MTRSTISAIPIASLIVFIVYIVHSAQTIQSMQISNVDSRLCARLCQCTSQTVDCNHQDGLSFIPTKINLEYHQLHISHASFENRGLSKENFSTITHLKSLKIVYSMLESLSDDTFSQMSELRYMDLSHNRFYVIESRAFNGLQLTNFYLEQNQGGLRISTEMFTGLTVTNLHLRSNNISQISVAPFQHLNIEKLYLFNNSITKIDRNFEHVFSSPLKLLDLTKNPLYCSCAMSWFPSLIQTWRDVPSFVQITCDSPTYLNGRLVASLSTDKFPCETPSINKISVDVSEHYLQLICHAKGYSPPQISWARINPYTGKAFQNIEDIRSQQDQSHVSINISNLQNDNSFLCRTWNEINSSNEILVKLRVMDGFLAKPQKPTSTVHQTEDPYKSQLPRNPNPIPETHFLFTKQFSILQMIGAVVGTFTSVIVLIFIICCSQEHILKKNPNSNMYWTTVPSELKSPYNRVVIKSPIPPSMAMVTSSTNSQDYDIPHESNNFLPGNFYERNGPHYQDVTSKNYFSTAA